MNTGEDDDVKLQRASAALIADLEALLPRLLRARSHGSIPVKLMWKACSLIEPFQEDPQILDPHLKTFLPPLVAAYLRTLGATPLSRAKKGFVPLSHAVCYILNVFCKVRSEKVIRGFLNNEPRYLLPILDELETGRNLQSGDDATSQQQFVVPWVERYILLLWLSHLLLAPFPLESISALQPSQPTSTLLELALSPHVPGITLRVLTVCFGCLSSASKERGAAAGLLVRLCARPDMQKLGLLDELVRWAVSFFHNCNESQSNIHRCLGVLSFLSGLVATTTNAEIGPKLPAIYKVCRSILDQSSLYFVKSSAVARKLIVKIMRNIVVHGLQLGMNLLDSDSASAIEEVIEFLLETMADGDTPVRYAASKSLSIITLKLDVEMAEEVIEAILGTLNESVYWQGSQRNLSAVSPLQWHGLTLTLSHLLYRKAIRTTNLPDVLNALLLSLSFEQRSPTGGSIGTNVRDAACFGIWALSRRYATSELLKVETTAIRACEHREDVSVPQALAIELVTVACLDPAGNIRRGSSAALQELIGRHPNTIEQGIPMVQVVDFHAVGLRQRALCDVALRAGELHPLYWRALLEGLLGWRGTGALDTDARLSAAKAVGLLARSQSADTLQWMANLVCSKLADLRPREVEERQGLVSALATLANTARDTSDSTSSACEERADEARLRALLHLWRLLAEELALDDKAFTSPALRPELTASSMLSFIAAMAQTTNLVPVYHWPEHMPVAQVTRILNLCLARHEDLVSDAITMAVPAVLLMFSINHSDIKETLLNGWLSSLENEASYNGQRCSGHAMALGSAYSAVITQTPNKDVENSSKDVRMRIVQVLAFRCTAAVAIEARTVALRALNVLMRNSSELPPHVESQIAAALHLALNDYTITERGDVGSLVRIEALEALGAGWGAGTLPVCESEMSSLLHLDVLRLSLEKLDKVRAVAARVLALRQQSQPCHVASHEDVSSVSYFLEALQALRDTDDTAMHVATCLGFVSSAGMASESVAQNAREALVQFTDQLSVFDELGRGFSLADFATRIMDIFKANIDNDRVLIPLMETLAFLFDMQVMQRLSPSQFPFRSLLSLTQKAHFKSAQMQKLHLALELYRGFGDMPTSKLDTLTKVTNMLLHPFPKAPETLWILTRKDALKLQDWSIPPKSLKPIVLGFHEELKAVAHA
ncbi:tubulin folding cofactor D C terminal-domain-containing protein [Paraphoma chrysanthemicola]|uniref:Tubulin folding cofactor D C terminal-domain-containing protein n=1 Tax=Paraphoma chrysanthemicola TaxID=798071 RepID=A0A8K0RBK6_9PLEO|nr:tubulin folding cofactor D C terminal-domain-containing protein [Paraphoma chrysanthemicola]